MKQKLFTLLTLLVGIASGAWADEVIFSMTAVTNGATDVTAGSTQSITATFNAGSSAEVKNGHGSKTATMISASGAVQINNSGASYFHATFTTALAAGDVITSSTEGDFYVAGTSTKPGSGITFPYTIKSTDTGLIGKTTLYVWNNGGKNFTSFTITRITGTHAPSITQSGTSVTLECATDGATIYYTTDGSEPTTSSSTYSSAIALTNSCTLRAFAKKGDEASAIVKKDCYVSHATADGYLTSLGYNGGTVSGDVWTGTNFVVTNNVEGRGIGYVNLAGSQDGFKLNHTDSYTIQPSEGIKVTKLVVVGKSWLQGSAGNAATIAFDGFTPASGTFFDYLTDGETYVNTVEFTPSTAQTFGQAIIMRPGGNQLGAYIEVYGEIKTYTVTYAAGANGTGTVAAGEKTHGAAFTLSSSKFTRDGFEQTGWATSDGGPQVYALGGSYTANADITLYPVWSKIVSTEVGSWDFTNWSDATKTGVLADETNWNQYEKKENAGTDLGETGGRSNALALSKNTIKYGSTIIPETNGLKFTAPELNDGKNFALIFDKKNILSEYDGNQYIWLMSSSAQIVIPSVKAGSVVSVDIESHKTTEERTITVKVGSTGLSEKSSKTGATTKTTMEYEVTADGDVTIAPSNKGLHILKIKVTEYQETVPVSTLDGRNYASFVATKKLDFGSADGITAYIATGLNAGETAVVLQEVDVVDAGTPIIVKTDTKGATVNVPVTTADPTDATDNKLVAGDGTTSYDAGTYYYLANDQFHLATSGTLQSGKAYLQISGSLAPQLAISFGNEGGTTGIGDAVKSDELRDMNYYNLAGQRVAQPTKGLYIVNGKKVVMK